MERAIFWLSLLTLPLAYLTNYGRHLIVFRAVLHQFNEGTGEIHARLGILSIIPCVPLVAASTFDPCSILTISLFAYFGAIMHASSSLRKRRRCLSHCSERHNGDGRSRRALDVLRRQADKEESEGRPERFVQGAKR